MRTLTVSGIIRNGYATGLKNAASLVGAFVLWALTCWIPYLNVGTTIGLLGLVAAMSKGEVISPTAIFASQYRKQMGEFFLVVAFSGLGTLAGALFLGIPGVVIALSWSLAPLLVIDRGVNPTEALQRSNDLTAGRKWKILLGSLLTSFTVVVLTGVLALLGSKVHVALGGLLALMGMVVSGAVGMGAQAYIYGVLTESRPAHPSDEGSAALSWGSAGAAVVGLILIGVLSPSGHSSRATDSMADFAPASARHLDRTPVDDFAKAVAAAQPPARPEARVEPEAHAPVVMPRIQAVALAVEFMKDPSGAKAAYDGNQVEISGSVSEVKVDPYSTTVRLMAPDLAGKFDRVTAIVNGKTSIRRGQLVTVRGTATVLDVGAVSVTVMNAEVVPLAGRSVASVGKKHR